MKKRCCLSSPQQNGGGSEQAGAACACGNRETLSGGPARWEPARFEERTSVYRETVAIFEKEAAFPEKTAGYGVAAIMGDLREKRTKQCATFYDTGGNWWPFCEIHDGSVELRGGYYVSDSFY